MKTKDWSNIDDRGTKATGRDVLNFIKLNLLNCELSIDEINNTINGEGDNSINLRMEKLENFADYIEVLVCGTNGINERVSNDHNEIFNIKNNLKFYSVKVGDNTHSKEYTQVHNVFRITRPNDSDNTWGITLPNTYTNSIDINSLLELRLGPFNELVTIGEKSQGADVEILNRKINLSELVDKGEEIIIKKLVYDE